MSAPPLPSIFDLNSLTALKAQVKANDAQAIKSTAKQFEALFLQMMLKSMRDATPKEGVFDSDQTRFYESLLDSQMAQVMAEKGGTGLAAMIERQMTKTSASVLPDETKSFPLNSPAKTFPLNAPRQFPLKNPGADDGKKLELPLSKTGAGLSRAADMPAVQSATADKIPLVADEGRAYAATATDTHRDFINKVQASALEAEKSSGIPAHFMVAQAALETGWGKFEPRHADGQPSYNLFGIKAGRNWSGPVVEASTSEYVGGKTTRQTERFRAYSSYAEAFQDYARLLASTPRYTAAYSSAAANRDASGFARGLQSAGYATDPQYASKLERIIGNPLLQQAFNT